MNMIIGKRQIILASLVLGLGIAVYLNWQYSNTGLDMAVTDALGEGTGEYGEAQYVDSVDEPQPSAEVAAQADEETFFVEAKLSRQKARDEATETLSFMLQDASLSSEERAELADKAEQLAGSIEIEGKIENMIKAKGFTDVMVYYDTERADIILKTSGLQPEEASQIKDIILRETVVLPENISIVEVN